MLALRPVFGRRPIGADGVRRTYVGKPIAGYVNPPIRPPKNGPQALCGGEFSPGSRTCRTSPSEGVRLGVGEAFGGLLASHHIGGLAALAGQLVGDPPAEKLGRDWHGRIVPWRAGRKCIPRPPGTSMDRKVEVQHLAEADRHIEHAEQNVAHVEELVAAGRASPFDAAAHRGAATCRSRERDIRTTSAGRLQPA